MITSKENQLIKYIKSLYQKKYREINNEYIVEGIKMAKEAIEIDDNLVSKIVICEDIFKNNENTYNEFMNLLKDKEITEKIEYVSRNVFEYISM